MHGNSEVRVFGVWAVYVYGAVCSLAVGCGSHVVVAEEAKHDDASRVAPDGGDSEGHYLGDAGATHITLCGKARCKDVSVVLPGTGTVTGYACCADPAHSQCGVVELTECVRLDYPGHLDPSCALPFSSNDFPGCCSPDGTCGLLNNQGCAELRFVPPSFLGTCVY